MASPELTVVYETASSAMGESGFDLLKATYNTTQRVLLLTTSILRGGRRGGLRDHGFKT